MKKQETADKPARETVFVSFYPKALPTMPEHDCGVTFNFPENLYRPLPELRKVFRRILDGGTDEDFLTVDGWLVYEIDSRKIGAVLAAKSAETEARAGHRTDAKHAAAVTKREKKEAEKLESRRRLWYQMAGKELPDDEQEATATNITDATTDATDTNNTSRKAERNITMNNTINFFAGIENADEARKRYHQLAGIYHTDTGAGDADTMVLINDQFAAFIGKSSVAADVPELPAGVIALPEHCETPAAVDEAAEYMDVIAALIKIPGIKVEICGKWLWVSGDTKPVKDQIKAAGLRFSGGKKMWYWHSASDAPRRRRGSKSMSYIRGKYGSRVIRQDEAV